MRIFRLEIPVLAAALTAGGAAPCLARSGEPPGNLPPELESSERQPGETVRPEAAELGRATPPPTQSAAPRGPVPADFEFFVRPGWNGLRVGAVDEITASAGDLVFSESVKDSRFSSSFGVGAGARAFRGRFGVEAGWQRFSNRDLVPLAVNEGAEGFEEFFDEDAPFVIDELARADLLFGQLLFRWTAPTGNLSLSFGAGAGYLRVDDPVTNTLDRAIRDSIPPEFASFFESSVTSDSSALLLGGSAGVSIRAGRLLLRPRLDVFFGRSLTREVGFRFADLDDLLPPGQSVSVGLSSSITPRFVLFGVDIGITSR